MRGHNEGSVYYDAERDRWVAEVTVELGRRKKFRFKTKQEAIRKKNEALRELEQVYSLRDRNESLVST